MVSEPAGNQRVMHYGLVRLVLEVRLPARLEMRSWPLLKLLQFFLSWPNLHAGLNTVRCQWPSAFDIPLVEDTCTSQ